MAWLIDPDFALQSRISFGRHWVYGLALVVFVALESLAAEATEKAPMSILGTASSLLLVLAFPYASIQLLAQERGGQLDLRRLTGRSVAGLSVALIAGASWLLLAAAVTALIAANISGPAPPPLESAAMLVTGAALAVMLIATPGSGETDRWMMLTFMVLAGNATLVTVRQWLSAAPALMVGGVCVSVMALPFALRRVRRPQAAVGVPTLAFRSLARLGRTRLPEISRSVLTSGASAWGALLLLAGVPVLVALTITRATLLVREALIMFAIYIPIIIASYECATRARAERASGAIERMRLSGQPSWSVVAQLAVGFSLPFLVVSIAAAVTLIAFAPSDVWTYLKPWPVLAVVCIFCGLTEGIAGRKLGGYLFAAPIVALELVKLQRTSAWLVAAALWVPAAIAAGRLERPDGPAVTGWNAVALAAAVGAVAGAAAGGLPMLSVAAGGVSVVSVLLLPDGRAWRSTRAIVLWTAAAAICAGLAEYAWVRASVAVPFQTDGVRDVFTQFRLNVIGGAPYAAITGGVIAAGLLFGILAHNLFGRTPLRSLLARSSALVVPVMLSLTLDTGAALGNLRALERWSGISWFEAIDYACLVALTIAVGVMLVVDRWRPQAQP